MDANDSRTTEQVGPRFGLVLDCADPDRLAEFWGAALDYINVGAADAYVALYPRNGDGPKLLLRHIVVEVPVEQGFTVFTDRFGDLKPPEHNLMASPITETVVKHSWPQHLDDAFDHAVRRSEH